MFWRKRDFIHLAVFDCAVTIESEIPEVSSLLRQIYSPFLQKRKPAAEALRYRVAPGAEPTAIDIIRADGSKASCEELGYALFVVEKEMTIALQLKRADLLFLHASVLAYEGAAFVIAAASGTGKSTTAWGLLHEGFDYLSDELAPIDLSSMQVQPYPRALGLKTVPPIYDLPAEVIHSGNGYQVPPAKMPGRIHNRVAPLRAIILLSYDPDLATSRIDTLAPSLAAAHIYTNCLNALSHPGMGLDACTTLAQALPCYRLTTAHKLKGASEVLINALRPS